MAEVERSQFVRATPARLERSLSPTMLVESEGSFEVRAQTTDDDATVVTVGKGGLAFDLRFEPRGAGYYYTQVGEAGPFESMETWVTYEPENEGSRVTMRSVVSLSLPLPFADRIAAWKRGGELERALEALANQVA